MRTALIAPLTAASFQRIGGLPLIQRTVLSAVRTGFDHIIVVADQYADRVSALLNADERTRNVGVVGNSRLLPALAESLVTVISGDCVLTPATLQRVNAGTVDGRPVLFTSAGAVSLALCRPAALAGLDAHGLATGSDALLAAMRAQGASTVALDGEVCVQVRDASSAEEAERALCARMRADSAGSDGPLAHWVDRHLSLRVSRYLVEHTRLRPNHITLIGTSIGLLAAAILSAGTYWAGVAGTLLFLSATILDGCDGEVARLTFQESAFGHKLDVITDNVVHVAIFVGLLAGLYRHNPSGPYAWLMVILLGGFACTSATTYFFLVHRPGFAERRGPALSLKGRVRHWLLRGFEGLINRDFAYLLVVLAVCDRLYWFVWGTAFGTYLFCLALIWIYRWRDAT